MANDKWPILPPSFSGEMLQKYAIRYPDQHDDADLRAECVNTNMVVMVYSTVCIVRYIHDRIRRI